jgi:glycosyltransferase involved in cell wall biosynthesis
MRVLLDTTYARRAPRSGTGIYIEQLTRALGARPDVEIIATANTRRRPPGGGLNQDSLRNAVTDELWTNVELPRRARRTRADLIHHPLPAHAIATRLPQLVTVHDLAFERHPGDFSVSFRVYAHVAHRHAARRARAVIAVSQTTADDLEELWGVSGPSVHVAPHGPGQTLPDAPATAQTHFLYVGDDEPRKDLPTLIAAYERYRARGGSLPLILAGAAHAQGPGISHEPGPSAARLAGLLAQAAALVHPARYEGFGLTVLEAMRLGTPVIAAASPAVVELTGGTARLFAPGDAAALTEALLAPPPPRSAQAALARAAGYTWERSAALHVAAYSWALGRS